MARLAIFGCLAVVALAVQVQASQNALEEHEQLFASNVDMPIGMISTSAQGSHELQQASSSLAAQSAMPEPFEFVATPFSGIYDDEADDAYAGDFYASNLDINIPEDVLAESLAFQEAQLLQNQALLQHQAQHEHQEEDQIAGASIRLPFRLPEDVTLFGAVQFSDLAPDSSSSAAAEDPAKQEMATTASQAGASDSSSDLILMSRLPVGLPLELGALQPMTSLVGELFNGVWQAVQQTGLLGGPVLMNPEAQQDKELAVDDSTTQETTTSSMPAPQVPAELQQDNLQDNLQAPEQPLDMEINVTVTSIRPQCFWARLYNRLTGRTEAAIAAMDEKEAAELAGAVVEALGRKGGSMDKPQELVMEMDSEGSYSSTISTDDDDDLSATAAAAIAAAAASVMQNDPDWDGMQMDVQITHTTQRLTATWGHAILLGIAVFMIHLGLSILLAPFYASWFGSASDADVEQPSQKKIKVVTIPSKRSKHSQFIVSTGLKEAGVYQALLTDQQQH